MEVINTAFNGSIAFELLGRKSNFSGDFDSNNEKKIYNKARKRLGKNWYFYDKKIHYKYNSNGFRTKEFKEIDWKNSIVVFGDSFVRGEAMALEDLFTTKLENELDTPIVNLGISGAGIDRTCWNSFILHEKYPKPKAIIQVWSNIHRYTDLNSTLGFVNNLPNRSKYCARHSWDLRNTFYVLSDRALWRNKVPYIEASVFEDTAKAIQVDYLNGTDKARDLDHWGPETHTSWTKYFSEKIREQVL